MGTACHCSLSCSKNYLVDFVAWIGVAANQRHKCVPEEVIDGPDMVEPFQCSSCPGEHSEWLLFMAPALCRIPQMNFFRLL